MNDLRKLQNTISTSLAALKNLDRLMDTWDDILVYLIFQKFSLRTRVEFKAYRDRLPCYKDITDFLTLHIHGLFNLSDSSKDTHSFKNDTFFGQQRYHIQVRLLLW